jgi:uncharacterized protein YdiU (UPF0061 family)
MTDVLFPSKKLKHSYAEAFASDSNDYFTVVPPTALSEPRWVSVNPLLAEEMGLNPEFLQNTESLQLLSGNHINPSLKPISLVYSGHQFGVWAGQLGDGRAITLGELSVKQADTNQSELWDLQLKGAGMTPYSRFADGRAVLRSSIREYLCSEAMHALGVPTTRALSLITSTTPVYREEVETASVICRVARSHIRFGSFEHFHYGKAPESVAALLDYVIQRHFPQWVDIDDGYQRLFDYTVTQTAKMIAHWQAIGFAHGVMNTDNMSILGETMDYGPFGFLDVYDPEHICNHSDTNGRYSFKNQPAIGLWNLNALATALMTQIPSEDLIASLKTYEPTFLKHYRQIMTEKLGFTGYVDSDENLINHLLSLMEVNSVDYSLLFRKLCTFDQDPGAVRDLFLDRTGFDAWAEDYRQRLDHETISEQQRTQTMLARNPKYILRNYMAQIAIEKAENGDFSEVNRLLHILQNPFDEHPEAEEYAGLPPDWSESLSVSCSS